MEEIKKFDDEGTVFGSIGKMDFAQMVTALPSADLIREYEEKARPWNDKIILNCEQITVLEKLRDTLLPKLMSGKISVETKIFP